MNDAEAKRLLHGTMVLAAFAGVILLAPSLFGVLGLDDATRDVLTAFGRLVTTVALAAFAAAHRRVLTKVLFGAPATVTPDSAPPLWRAIASAAWLPLLIVYFVGAWAFGAVRQILDLGNAGNLVIGPILAVFVGLLTYGVLLLIVDRWYERPPDRGGTSPPLPADNSRLSADHGVPPLQRLAFRSLFARAAAIVALFVAVVFLLQLWGISVLRSDHPLVQIVGVLVVVFGAYLAYQSVRIWFDRKIADESLPVDEAGSEEVTSGATRLATLLPIFRNFVLIFIVVLVVMVVLAEIGVNIAPLFAGAGVVGLAVGFGAQTLIRDIFSGAFFLLDDAFRKGEYVEVGGTTGAVERILLRSMQLRHHNGPLHTIPFGEITQLTNYSRDWVVMKLPIRLPHDTDIEKVRKLIKRLGREMAAEPEFDGMFLDPPKSQGVVDIDDSAMIVRIKFMTRPGSQFIARRHVYTRLQELLAREGIRFANRQVIVRVQSDEPLSPAAREAAAGAVLEN